MSLLLKLAGRLPQAWVYAFSRVRSTRPWLKRATDWIPDQLRDREDVIQNGAGRGLRFCAGGSAAGFLLGTHDPNIQRALTALVRPGMVVYDVGANVGFTAMIAARLVGPTGQVVCFEPQPECARVLHRNADINGFRHVTVRSEALGDTNGTARFIVSKNSTFSRLAGVGKADGSGREITVQTRTLDELIESDSLPKPDVLKIDVEGAELQVLAGAARTLRGVAPVILVELHGTNGDIAKSLADAGYLTRVVGSTEDVATAHWNALAVAVSRHGEQLLPDVDALTRASVAAY